MPSPKNQGQIQVRIDSKTKEEAKKILEDLGLDISTAVKILFKQITRTGTLPIDLRDINGFSEKKANELKESILDAKKSKKSFNSSQKLLKSLSS